VNSIKFNSRNMSRKSCLQTLSGVAISGVAGCTGALQPPNLLFVFPDQFRAQAMGFMGEDPVITPNLDRLAAEGVVFNNAVSTHPLCSPYRGMLMTGKYSWKTGLVSNCNTYSRKYGVYLRESERCLTDVLHDTGYDVGYLGKWHLDTPAEGPDVDDWRGSIWDTYTPPGPKRHGINFWHSYGCYDDHLQPHYWIGDDPAQREFHEWSPEHETNTAIEYLQNRDGRQRDADKPFALFMAMNPPHPPFNLVPDRYRDYYRDAGPDELLTRPNVRLEGVGAQAPNVVQDYFSAVTGVDEQLGRLLQCLKTEGLDENTIVVFTADHGEKMGSHGSMGKGAYYEESFRVPMIFRWPTVLKPVQEPAPMGSVDIMPTLLGLMGQEREIPADVQGVNLAPVMQGQSNTRPQFALYATGGIDTYLGRRGLRSPQHTFCLSASSEIDILYDNLNDPYQLQNIAADNPSLTSELSDMLKLQLAGLDDPLQKG
jgi:arylsulfatase A-like enzyme